MLPLDPPAPKDRPYLRTTVFRQLGDCNNVGHPAGTAPTAEFSVMEHKTLGDMTFNIRFNACDICIDKLFPDLVEREEMMRVADEEAFRMYRDRLVSPQNRDDAQRIEHEMDVEEYVHTRALRRAIQDDRLQDIPFAMPT